MSLVSRLPQQWGHDPTFSQAIDDLGGEPGPGWRSQVHVGVHQKVRDTRGDHEGSHPTRFDFHHQMGKVTHAHFWARNIDVFVN